MSIIIKKLICNEHYFTVAQKIAQHKRRWGRRRKMRRREKITYQPLLLLCLAHEVSMDSPPLNIVYGEKKIVGGKEWWPSFILNANFSDWLFSLEARYFENVTIFLFFYFSLSLSLTLCTRIYLKANECIGRANETTRDTNTIIINTTTNTTTIF